ncbi:Ig-like domain-containing protein [Paenibacillus foliorum]|uniref:Ig-like domain-containing protein n=1 Tax=Paenibacillus foliorum TaxID=2654974 RepID=UPI001491EEB0|nr:Ig-like domain-containing protein [Paenibacillus foliorum]
MSTIKLSKNIKRAVSLGITLLMAVNMVYFPTERHVAHAAVVTPTIPTVVSTYVGADKTEISAYDQQVHLKVMAKMSSGPDKELKKNTASNSTDPQLNSVHYSSTIAGVTIDDTTGILTYDGSSGQVPVNVSASVNYLDVVYFEGFEGGTLGSFTHDPGATNTATTSVVAKTGVPAHSGSYSANRNNSGTTNNTLRADMGTAMKGTVTAWVYNGTPAGNSRNNIFVGTKLNAATNGVDISNGLLLGEHWDGGTGSGTQFVSRIMTSSFSPTSAARGTTPAWHEFKWDLTSGTGATMYIDGAQVAATNAEAQYQYIALVGNWKPDNSNTYYDDIKATKLGTSTSSALSIPVTAGTGDIDSLTVSGQGGASTITADAGSLQMTAAVTPSSASSKVTWKVENQDGTPTNKASISSNGVLSAIRNGAVKVTATSAVKPAVSNSLVVTISGQTVKVTELSIQAPSGATSFGTLDPVQLSATALPADAGDQAVTWSVIQGTDVAAVSNTGVVTPVKSGTVQIQATAKDGSNVKSNILSLTFAIKLTTVTVVGAGGATSITALAGSLQMEAVGIPAEAANKNVVWTVENGTGSATISSTGLLRAISNGTVTVKATAQDGSGVAGQCVITISGQSYHTYYISITSGNDANDGLSEATAWKSLDKVNASTFSPGDKIGFKAGDIWNGQLRLNGSGAEGLPIKVDKYGSTDPEVRPIFNGMGTDEADGVNLVMPLGSVAGQHYAATVEVRNQSFWEISNLEVTNYDATTKNMRAGIIALNEKGVTVTEWEQNQLKHIVIRDCYVHDVNSDPSAYKMTGGILILGNYSDVLVEGNKVINVAIEGIRNAGMAPSGSSNGGAPQVMNNIVFKNNYIQDVQGDGMVISNIADNGDKDVYNGIVEYNTILRYANTNVGSLNYAANWVYGSKDTLFQYNETFGGIYGYNDGEAWDVDLYSDNIVYQYNYSHENRGGIILFMGTGQSVFRYNLSVNDGNGAELFFYHPSSYTKAPWIYNNTIFTGKDIATTVFNNSTPYIKFANNIMMTLGKVKRFANVDLTQGYIKNNIFYPNILTTGGVAGSVELANNLYVNPQLARPGEIPKNVITAKNRFDVSKLEAYKILANSPAIGAGWKVDLPSTFTDVTKDMFGNPLGSISDIGIHQFTNDVPTHTFTEVLPTSVELNQANVSLLVGEASLLGTIIEPATAWNKTMTWESDKPSVATVDSNGAVKAVAIGTANITVKSTADPRLAATTKITVKAPITTTSDMIVEANYPYLDATNSKINLKIANVMSDGSTRELKKKVTELNEPRLNSVTYSTDNSNVSIDSDGLLTVTGDLGSASEIHVTANVSYEDVVYSEGFEDGTLGDFAMDSGTDYAVSVQSSTEQAHSGAYSLKRINAVKSVMSKAFSTDMKAIASMWIYDDGTTKANRAVGSVGAYRDNTKIMGLGLFYDGSLGSASQFATRFQTTNWSVSNVPRSVGWHELKWDYTGPMVNMFIDDQPAGTFNSSSFRAVSLMNLWNSSAGNFYYDDIRVVVPRTNATAIPLTVKVNATQIDGVRIWGEDNATSITTDKGTLQIKGGLIPNQLPGIDYSLIWSLEEETGRAMISNTGLLTAIKDGRVKVIAQSVANPSLKAEMYVTISNQYVSVTEVSTRGTNDKKSIDVAGGTLQLIATISPSNATNKKLTWKILNTDGSSTKVAQISNTGLVTAVVNGTARVHAISEDGGFDGPLDITVTNQPVLVEGIEVKTPNGENSLEVGRMVALSAVITPNNAVNKAVTWSVNNQNGTNASITTEGVFSSGDMEGEVTVVATAQDALGTVGSKRMTLTKTPTEIVKANKDTLKAKIVEAEGKLSAAVVGSQAGEYPQSAVDTLKREVMSAKAVVSNIDAVQQEVDQAVIALARAVIAFDSEIVTDHPTEPKANKDALNAKIAEAEGKLGAAAVGSLTGQYPQSAVDTLKQEVTSAKAVVSNKDAAQQEVDQAEAELNIAIKAFESTKIPYRNNSSSHHSTAPSGAAEGGGVVNVIADDGTVAKHEFDPATATVTIHVEDKERVSLTFNSGELKESQQVSDGVRILIRLKGFIYELATDVTSKVVGIDNFLQNNQTTKDQLKVNVQVEATKLTPEDEKVVEQALGAESGLDGFNLVSGMYNVHLRLEAPNGQIMEVKAFDSQRTMLIEVSPSFKDKVVAALSISEGENGEKTAGIRTAKYVEIDGKSYMQIKTASHSKYGLVEHHASYMDVTMEHWAKAPIEEASSRLLLSGVGQGRFNPDAQITRAEYITMLIQAMGLPKTADNQSLYEDVRSGDWYYANMAIAHKAGLLKWIEGNSLKPNAPITRAEMARATVAAAQYLKDGSLVDADLTELSKFMDADKVSASERSDLAWCIEHGLINGTVDVMTGKSAIAPSEQATRAQAAAIMLRLLREIGLI